MGKVLPILFNTEMVCAILDGRKMVTRRICRDGDIYTVPDMKYYDSEKRTYAVHCYSDVEHTYANKISIAEHTCPICPGDILYVREAWRVGYWDIPNQVIAFDYKDGTCGKPVYMSDRDMFDRLVNQSREDARKAKCEYDGADFIWEKGKSPCRWHPSIHMPKQAARIWLKVMDVRVERLQEIDGCGILAEGINNGKSNPAMGKRWENMQRIAFSELWDSTIKETNHGQYGWDANPWVWVIVFERCEKPESCGNEKG